MASCPSCGKAKIKRDKHGRRKCQRCGVLPSNKHLDQGGNPPSDERFSAMQANGEGVINAMAEAISDYIDLDNLADVALELVSKGYSGAMIGNDLPAIIERARELRAAFESGASGPRNQITDIAATAAQF